MPTPSRTVRVFLSSTFRDFAEERDLLVRKVFPELRRKCRERQVELVDTDLRRGIIKKEAQQFRLHPRPGKNSKKRLDGYPLHYIIVEIS